jgi:anaerobic ribonucleoside-triphosphate reductase
MPEKGWYSLTARMETAKRARELAKARDLTVDELINELMKPTSGVAWVRCSLCRAEIKAENMPKHMARAHPEIVGR